DEDLGDAAEVVRVAAARLVKRLALVVLAREARVRLAVLGDELPVLGELHDLRIARTVAADPDHAGVIDEDAVVRRRPVVAGAGAAPVADEVAGLVEGENRRRAGDSRLR